MNQPEESPNYLYKILTDKQWQNISENDFGFKYGSVLDIKDGYLHLSQAHQVKKVAYKYFEHLELGTIVKLDYMKIKDQIKWEPNSKGELFPHSYEPIPKEAIVSHQDFNTQEFNYDLLEP